MNYLVAVSGGVDSVVLLDVLARSPHRVVVAHVDHGIRPESAADARFVEALAKSYRLPFVSTTLELGAHASEAEARMGRYAFLGEQAKKFSAVIATAHHQDDLIETIAINLERGTGWRGLAVMANPSVMRPLLGMTKAQLYAYALRRRLEWVEDETNATEAYLRNRLRKKINQTVDKNSRKQLLDLRSRQLILRQAIGREAERFVERATSRHFLTLCGDEVAEEILGRMVKAHVGQTLTRPEKRRALLAVKTAKPGAIHQIGRGLELQFTSRNLSVDVV